MRSLEECRDTFSAAPLTHADSYSKGFRDGMEQAAKLVEGSWRSGYRGEVNSGFKHVILAWLKRPHSGPQDLGDPRCLVDNSGGVG